MSDLPPPPHKLSALQRMFRMAEKRVRGARDDLKYAQQSGRAALRETDEMIRLRRDLIVVDDEEWTEGGVDPQQVEDLLSTIFEMIILFERCTYLADNEARVQADLNARPQSRADQRLVKWEVAASDIQLIPRKVDDCCEGRKAVTCTQDGSLHDEDELSHAVQTKVGSDKEVPENAQDTVAAADNSEQMTGDPDSTVGEFHVQRDYLREQHGTVEAKVESRTTIREGNKGDKACKDGQPVDSVTNELTVTGNHELDEQKQPMENIDVGARGMRGGNPEEEGGQIHRLPTNGAASAEPGVTPVQVMLDRSCRGSEGWRHDGAHAGISNEVRDMGAGCRGASWCRDREIGESFDGGGRIGSVPWETTSHQCLIQCE